MCVNWCNLFLGEALINRSVATSVDSFVGNFGYGFWVSNLQITWTPFIRPAAVRLKTVSGKKDTGRVRFFGLRRNFQKLFSYRCFGFSVWPTAKNGLYCVSALKTPAVPRFENRHWLCVLSFFYDIGNTVLCYIVSWSMELNTDQNEI